MVRVKTTPHESKQTAFTQASVRGVALTVSVALSLGALAALPTTAAFAAEQQPFAPVSTIATPNGVSEIELSADQQILFTFDAETGNISAYDLDNCASTGFGITLENCVLRWSVKTPSGARGWFVDKSAAGRVFVVSQQGENSSLSAYAATSGAQIGETIAVPGLSVHALTVVPQKNFAYLLAETGVLPVNLSTAALGALVPLRSDSADPKLLKGQRAIVYNPFSKGSNNSTPDGIVYAAFEEFLTTVNVATNARVEITRRLTTPGGIMPSKVSTPEAAAPSLLRSGYLGTGAFRSFGLSSQKVHGYEQNAVYLLNTLEGGSTSTNTAAWIPADPRGLAISAAENLVVATSASNNSVSFVSATATGSSAPVALAQSVDLNAAGVTQTGIADVESVIAAEPLAGNPESKTRILVANQASKHVTVLERRDVLQPGTPVVAGAPKFGEAVTAEPGSWTEGTEFGYRWAVDGVTVPNQTSRTYRPVATDVGKTISVTVTGMKAGFAPTSRTSAATTAVSAAELQAGEPKIEGTAVFGQTLRVEPGTWSEGTDFNYLWSVDGTVRADITGAEYQLGLNDIGKTVSVAVTGSQLGYTSTTREATSSETVRLAERPAFAAVIAGGARVGQTLTARVAGLSQTAKTSYQWTADGKRIAGATSSSLLIRPVDQGKRIAVSVTAAEPGYTVASVVSGTTGRVAKGVLTATQPKISGTAKVGKKLSVKTGSWTQGTKLSIRWYANGKRIGGAAGKSLKLSAAHRGKRITVAVAGTKAGFTTATKSSKATAKVTR